jgi:DNA-binding NtrC family response regulator
VSPEALALLVCHPWPGNVRELFNVVENAVAMNATDEIGVDDLRHAAGRGRVGGAAQSSAEAPLPTLEAAERTLIEATLRSTAGNKVHAARQLGISRTQLYVKMAKFGLSASRSRSN